MTPAAFATLRPELYHVAAGGGWVNILRLGLLSTTALLDLHDVRGSEREALESRRRRHSHILHHPVHGTAVIRDQKPLNERALASQLTDGWSVRDWHAKLNRMAFLFPTLKAARAFSGVYRDQENDLLAFDTAYVVEHLGTHLRYCTINSGAPTSRAPTPRGPKTFRKLADFDLTPGRVREVSMIGGLADVVPALLRVERLAPDDSCDVIWRRGDPLPPSAVRA